MKVHILLLSILSGLSLIGCSSANGSDTNTSLEQKVVDEGDYVDASTNKNITVLKTQDKYSEVLLKYSTSTAETLDFTQGNILLVDMGRRLNGCAGIKSINAIEDTNSINVDIIYNSYPANVMCTQAITNPYKFVWIKSKKEILVSESMEQL